MLELVQESYMEATIKLRSESVGIWEFDHNSSLSTRPEMAQL
jgi:hypothetical protein